MVRPGLGEIVSRLLDHFGPQEWWPAKTPFEVMLGAVLTQNTAWRNVELAIRNLRKAGALNPSSLASLPQYRIKELIRPTGYFHQKARKLRTLLEWFIERYDGSIEQLRKLDQQQLRGELLSLWGIGPETADSILLYALSFPAFVVDAYTIRVLVRHDLVPSDAGYDEVQRLASRQLPADEKYLNEAHALFVAVGKKYCKRKQPLCENCPLKALLSPEGGYHSESEKN